MRTAADAKNRGRIPNPSFDKLRMRSVEWRPCMGPSFIPQGRPRPVLNQDEVRGKSAGQPRLSKRRRWIVITLINVFKVEPSNQQRLIELLIRATDGLVDAAPGFLSSTLHRSLDGTKVTMYAQWRSHEDYEAMRRDPGPLPLFREALTIATFEPGMYEVVRTFAPRPSAG